jgi:hypothetical protein
LKPPKYRLYRGAGIFKNPSVAFIPYQVNNNAEGYSFHSSDNSFPLEMKAPNCTVDGGHASV